MIIGILNQKGGVGKTTTSVNLGAAFAKLGKKVLLIDVDAQSNLTTSLGISNGHETDENPNSPLVPEYTIYDVLKGNKTIDEVTIERSENIYVVPSSILLSAADLELGGVVGRELLIKRAVKPVVDKYDIILLDCPPTLGLLSLNALSAIDQVIIPVQSEYLALHGVKQLLDTIDQVRSIYNPSLEVGGVLICMHDSRRKLDRAIYETINDYFGNLVFDSVIRDNVALAEAPASGMSIFEHAPKSAGAEDYMSLAEEIVKNG